MHWYLAALRNYVNFGGRARRKEFWQFFLISMIITFMLQVAEVGLHMDPYVSSAYSVATFLPSAAVVWRRLHDTGRSFWWLLATIVPVVGAIFVIAFLASDSQPYENEYGPSPKPFPGQALESPALA